MTPEGHPMEEVGIVESIHTGGTRIVRKGTATSNSIRLQGQVTMISAYRTKGVSLRCQAQQWKATHEKIKGLFFARFVEYTPRRTCILKPTTIFISLTRSVVRR